MRASIALAALALALAAAAPAAAHVEVLPETVEQQQAGEFTIRVPTERNLATVGVRVEFPPQITVYSIEQPPRPWRVQPVLAPDGRVRGAVWSGGRIGVGRYQDFHVLGTPFELGRALWPVRQIYADGVVKPWTGPPEQPGATQTETSDPGAQGPAAAVQVVQAGAAPATPSGAAGGGGSDDSDAAIWLGVIAIVISVIAALAAGWLWSTRPARLPDDPEDGG
jgi:uncharacterized protein YcnI